MTLTFVEVDQVWQKLDKNYIDSELSYSRAAIRLPPSVPVVMYNKSSALMRWPTVATAENFKFNIHNALDTVSRTVTVVG